MSRLLQFFLISLISIFLYNACKDNPAEAEKGPTIDMILVSGGTFQMGDTWGDGSGNEKPVHTVTVDSFYISKYEITQPQYSEITGSNPSHFKGEYLPVDMVSWIDAVMFCNQLSVRKGLTPCYTITDTRLTCDFKANGYRLPTEAEWEYAARGGNKSQGYRFSGSDDVEEVAWHATNSDGTSHFIGLKMPNELGIYDMSGNIREYCWDIYSLYTEEAQDNPTGPTLGWDRVMRGGCWAVFDLLDRVSSRNYISYTSASYCMGIRVVRNY